MDASATSATSTTLNGVAAPPAAPADTGKPTTEAVEKVAEAEKKADAAPTEAKKDDSADRLAAMARREVEIQKKYQALAAERDGYKKREAEFKTYEEIKAKAKSAPLKVLEQFGLTHEDVTNALLAEKEGGASAQKIREEIAAERKAREELENRIKAEQEARDKAEQDEAVRLYQKQAEDFVEANKEKYELVAMFGPQAVIAQIQKVYNESSKDGGEGRIISFDEAAQAVEAEFDKEIEKALATKKWSTRYKKIEAQAATPTTQTKVQQQPVRTLGQIPQATTPTESKDLPIDKMERIRAITKKLEG